MECSQEETAHDTESIKKNDKNILQLNQCLNKTFFFQNGSRYIRNVRKDFLNIESMDLFEVRISDRK